ncbi:orc1/cdc6 family replication initiation protein [Candidatus Woesearchaeota archaeon]|nr:orc1/cdc6 family replication initiation protein [Candidatus Woesearchaeota archaeon]
MTEKPLDDFFEKFLNKESVFSNKRILESKYTPETVPHRDEQIKQIANILAPCLKLDKPSNLFIYGKTGTGKTLSVKCTTNKIKEMADLRGIPVCIIYINCKLKRIADTEYRLIAEFAKNLGKEIPATGLPTQEVYNLFYKELDSKEQLVILVLDEIDQIKKAGNLILYNLTRINQGLQKSQVSIIGISNDLTFADNLDARVKSSLSEEELIFPSYNAIQLQEILRDRADQAFRKESIEVGVIEKCAAYAAREHGDARRALELLRVAGDIADRGGGNRVKIEHIDEAEFKIEKDRVLDIVSSQPKQFQATLFSIISIYSQRKGMIFTGEVYELYKGICSKIGIIPLTQRRLSDIIAELDMLGIITAKVISKGRYGRTREIDLAIPHGTIGKINNILLKALELKEGD